MGAFFSAVLAKFVALAKWFGLLFFAVFLGAWDMLRDLLCWGFDEMLTAAESATSSVDTTGASWSSGWSSLPAEILNICGLIGIGDAISIIVAAIMIRMALQLIPFVRLGS